MKRVAFALSSLILSTSLSAANYSYNTERDQDTYENQVGYQSSYYQPSSYQTQSGYYQSQPGYYQSGSYQDSNYNSYQKPVRVYMDYDRDYRAIHNKNDSRIYRNDNDYRNDNYNYRNDSYNYRNDGYNYKNDNYNDGYKKDSDQGIYRNDKARDSQIEVYIERDDSYRNDGYNYKNNKNAYGYKNDSYRNDNYKNDRNDGYRIDGYRNDSYRNDGYRNDSYRNDGYRIDGYRKDSYSDNYRNDGYSYRNDRNDRSDKRSDKQVSYEADRDLMNRIRIALEGDGTVKKYQAVDIQVFNGVVTLTGAVESSQDKQYIVDTVKQVKGVKQVDDQLEVRKLVSDNTRYAMQNERSQVDNDEYITKEMRDIVKKGFFSSAYEGVTFDVNHGSVVLRGTVENEKDRRDLMEKVAKIEGVFKIDNQVQVMKKA